MKLEQKEILRKKRVLEYAEACGNVLKTCRHNQANAIDFVEYVVEKFPFRIQCIRTDRGHEFQAKFHWHVEDRGIRHAYIKPRTPQLNGKVERSHRSDQ